MKALLAKFGFGVAEAPAPSLETATADLNGANLAVAYLSGREGGDYYDFARVSPTRFLFGLLDVAGKREDNRKVLDAARDCFRACGAELFSNDEVNEAEAMVELARRLNREIMRAAGGVRSCPAFAGCYNEELATVCYVNAGHTPALLCDSKSVEELPATGLPLGLFSLAPTDARIVGMATQSSMVVVSRGVVEAQHRAEEFGLGSVKSILQKEPAPAGELSRDIVGEVQAFLKAAPRHNDVTALALTRLN